MRLIALALFIAVAGCDSKPEPLNWLQAPNDPEVRAFVFDRCLSRIKSPTSTHYNDWDEAMESCRSEAGVQSLYCPTGAICETYLSSRADVRAILPKGEAK